MAAIKLSTYFSYDELAGSSYAARQGLDNTPPAAALAALKYTANMMDRVRALLGVPIIISSGYRSPVVNTAINGSPNSQHVKGEAVDFTAPSFGSPADIARAIAASHIPFDQLILEYNAWVHISFVRVNPRIQTLTITRQGTRQGIYQ